MPIVVRQLPWRPVPYALGIATLLALSRCGGGARAQSPEAAVLLGLERQGLQASAQELSWVEPPSALGTAVAIVRAWKQGEPADIFLVHARVTPAGALLEAPSAYNLTSTDSADEGPALRSGNHVVFDVRQAGVSTGIRSLDLSGEAPLQGSWTLLARAQNSLTNLQQTGQLRGVGNSFWTVEPPSKLSLTFVDGTVRVQLDTVATSLPVAGGDPIQPCEMIRFNPAEKARPGNLVTWAVDRVRAFPWFGDERMQWLKAVAFGGLDWIKRAQAKVTKDSTASDIAADLGDIGSQSPPTSYTDPETGWPPAPMKPWITKPPVEGEGQWIPLDKDPFVAVNPGAPPAFVTSFIRADRERAYTRVYVTLWDPRQVELHMMAGSIEPRGPSGEAGPGLIPRAPERMKRLVAACNGGFQAFHGEFGVMADGVVYLPPKPYSSTVLSLKDGWTGFGTWPNADEIPPDVLSFRQNLTALVQDSKFNPYGRTWWGGTPPDWEDRVHSTRTGICLTEEGFVAFFYGNEIDSAPLARAMLQARCKYGIHLDMNPGHTGLEFYRAMPTSQMQPLGRPMQKDWEAEGVIEGMDGWSFRGRRMIRHMGLMNFPRYIQREARDFMYLMLRPVLPGEDLAPIINPAEPDEGKWRTKGLPHHGFPYAVATTMLRPDASRPAAHVYLLKMDPRALRPAGMQGTEAGAQTVLSVSNANVGPRHPSVWFTGGAVSVAKESPGKDAFALVSGIDPDSPEAANSYAALGVQDEDGMLVYAEVQTDRRAGADAAMLKQVLGRMGCSAVILLHKPLLPAFGEAGPARDGRGNTYERVVKLVRVQSPGAKVVFPDTPVVGPKEWAPLQARRVRYFKKPTPASSSGSGSTASPPTAPTEAPAAP
ncbi:MAG: hypothetical protein HY898_13290 [Deltaproteobacteria bacterium]|nr:hypothetical protein [Deltaproteobacteria bacterium]